MEVKKNPSVDPKRNSFLYFQIGLVAVLLLTYIGIEMKTMDPVAKTDDVFVANDLMIEEEEPIITVPLVQQAPPPPPPAPEIIEVIKDEIEIEEEEEIQVTEVQDVAPVEVVEASAIGDPGGTLDDNIPDEMPFAVIEQVPLFPGCEKVAKSQQSKCFQEKLDAFVKKNFRMPDDLESGFRARVFVQFLIDKQGNITNVKAKGGNSDLEREALRTFSKAPKLQPGKQRGQAVKCSFTYPIMITTR